MKAIVLVMICASAAMADSKTYQQCNDLAAVYNLARASGVPTKHLKLITRERKATCAHGDLDQRWEYANDTVGLENGVYRYPNGAVARTANGVYKYPNGTVAKSGTEWFYPAGQLATKDGTTWFDLQGNAVAWDPILKFACGSDAAECEAFMVDFRNHQPGDARTAFFLHRLWSKYQGGAPAPTRPPEAESCIDWIHAELTPERGSASARDLARERCKAVVSVETVKMLYPFFKGTYGASIGIAKAIEVGNVDLTPKRDIVMLAIDKYQGTYGDALAAARAVERAKSARTDSYQCLAKEQAAYAPTFGESLAMDKAFAACAP